MRKISVSVLFLAALTGCTVDFKTSAYGVSLEVEECVNPVTGEVTEGPCPEDCNDFVDNDGDGAVDMDDEDCAPDSGEEPEDSGELSDDTGQ